VFLRPWHRVPEKGRSIWPGKCLRRMGKSRGSGSTFIGNNYGGLPSTSDRQHRQIKHPVKLPVTNPSSDPNSEQLHSTGPADNVKVWFFAWNTFAQMPCLPTELELGNMFYWHFELCSSAIVLSKTGDWGRWKMRLVAYHWKLKFILYLLNVDCDSAEMWRIKQGRRDSLGDKHNDLMGNSPLSYLIMKIK